MTEVRRPGDDGDDGRLEASLGAGGDGPPPVELPARARIAPVAVGAAAAAVVGLIAVLALGPSPDERQTRSPLIGQVAPAITGATFDDAEVDLDRYRGRWVLVNFFATWCVPCVEEHPELVEFDRRHRASGDAAVVSVVVETPTEEARRFFARHGGDWPVVIDPEARTSLAYGMVKVPETFVVAPNGVVVERLIGGVTADSLDRIIDAYEQAALAGSQP